MASIENTAPPPEALQSLCDAARAIVERDFKPRPGAACSTAPNSQHYQILMGRYRPTPSQAMQELENWLRAAIVSEQGDTVWWRNKPRLDQHPDTKEWRASARLRLGWAKDEMPAWTPGKDCEYGTAYADVTFPPGTVGAPDQARLQLPRWKCHKVVEADKIVGVKAANPGGKISWDLELESGAAITVGHEFMVRVPAALPVGGYLVRYSDGYLSWSPADAFEGGYTRMTL